VIRKMSKGKEIAVGVENEVGVLTRITSFLVNHGINLEAIAGKATRPGEAAGIMFITDNNSGAIDALMKHGFTDIQENSVLIVELENHPGALKNISEVLAQNSINIMYLYGTTCMGGCPAKLIIATSDNDRAFRLLSEKQ